VIGTIGNRNRDMHVIARTVAREGARLFKRAPPPAPMVAAGHVAWGSVNVSVDVSGDVIVACDDDATCAAVADRLGQTCVHEVVRAWGAGGDA